MTTRRVQFVVSRYPAGGGQGYAADLSNPLALDPAECRRSEDALAEGLRAAGGSVLVVPHLYYLTETHAVVRRLSEWPDTLVVASWLYPRASYWTLRALGVDGASAEAAEAESPPSRAIHCLFLREDASPEACLSRLAGPAPEHPGGRGGVVEDISAEMPPRWYPVLDYERCRECGQCHDFCLFGVFTREGRRVLASDPDKCKPGCPACARLCPAGAIIFPHCSPDPAIAGAPGDGAASGGGEEAGPDDLDQLIDALDELD